MSKASDLVVKHLTMSRLSDPSIEDSNSLSLVLSQVREEQITPLLFLYVESTRPSVSVTIGRRGDELGIDKMD